jgi:hypothetical protein
MQNLKKTLNRVFNEQAKAYIVTPCCEALKNLKYDNHKSLFDEIRDYDLADPEQWASFKARYFITLLEDVMVSYCQCLRSPQNAASWRCLQEIEEFFEKVLLFILLYLRLLIFLKMLQTLLLKLYRCHLLVNQTIIILLEIFATGMIPLHQIIYQTKDTI